MNTAVPLISTNKVELRLDRKVILSNMDFAIHQGEIVTIVGPNGSGKSSFLRLLVGALSATLGDIKRSDDLRIGYIPQHLMIDHTMPITVDRFLRLSGQKDADKIINILEVVGLIGQQKSQMAMLSGGQFQRMLLAHALLRNPNLLVLDEPTQGLDQPGIASFYRLIESVRNKTNCAVLMVSHDLHVVMSASDRVICLNGHICCEGTPTVVSNAPEYRNLFGYGSGGALAMYRHEHDHTHDHEGCDHDH